jgi:biopolymer transport protein TolR
MAAIESGGGDGKRSSNIDLNVVPFIDLMTCLVAFLLVTAVWTNLAQISIKPKGVGRDAEQTLREDEPVRASILITEHQIWVGLSRINDFRQIAREGDDYNWEALSEVLEEHKNSAHFLDREDIEIAAEDRVDYQSIISAMDVAIGSGFIDVGLADPASLSARPQL